MAELLFRLTNVPSDEADEIRQLLDDNNIAYYETQAGTWGVGTAAIWLADDAQKNTARELLDNYQRQRQLQAQQNPVEHSLWRTFLTSPVKFIVYSLLIGAIIYLSTVPFFVDWD